MKKSINELQKLLQQSQNAVDFKKMAKCYFNLGKAYKEAGQTTKAIYYLNRFDNLISGDDTLYSKFQNDDDKAMDWIDSLQEDHEPYELTIQNQVMDKSKNLNTLQKMQWLLLTMSRFCRIFEELSQLPNYDFFGFENLGEMIDYFSAGLYGVSDENADEALENFYNTFDEVFESPLMSNYTLKIQLPNQESFVPADLESGDVGTFYFGAAYSTLQSYIANEPEDENDIEMAMRFAACGILADYYYRTSDSDIQEETKIKEETERIFSDYDFVKGTPDKETFLKRIESYKQIMLI